MEFVPRHPVREVALGDRLVGDGREAEPLAPSAPAPAPDGPGVTVSLAPVVPEAPRPDSRVSVGWAMKPKTPRR